jgi:hypothetical protein
MRISAAKVDRRFGTVKPRLSLAGSGMQQVSREERNSEHYAQQDVLALRIEDLRFEEAGQ